VFDLVLLRTYIRKQTPFLTKSNFASEFLADKHIGSVRTVGVGLDVEQISKTTAEPHPTVQKICNSKDRHLLYVGRIEPRRNITSMFDVFRAVRTDFPDARLVVIGDGEEGYVRKCFEHADSIGVSDWIIHEKKLTQGQLPDLYRACDAFLLPTLYEIFGMVLLEAMFFGCPVITSINGGSDVLIRHRENGMVVDGHDIKKWMEAISEVLNDSEFASGLGASARDTICRHFTWERLAGSFVDAYQQVNEVQTEVGQRVELK
jgi:glycosyltransferase involved in cell wall biosynthesis